MKKQGEKKTGGRIQTRRVYLVIAAMVLWAAVIGAKLYFLHVVVSADYRHLAERQQQRILDLSPRRGVIYDRNGNELAASIKVDSVFAVPDEIRNPEATAAALSSLLSVPKQELLGRFDEERSFVWIKRKLNGAEAAAVRRAKLPGIYFQKEDRRFYPKRELAAHVLGYVDIDERGLGGLEYRYNGAVRGEGGRVLVMTDARGRSFNSVEQPVAPGASLITTIDENIQYALEKELRDAEQRTNAVGISAVVMNPHNGEILAMANYPTFDPNEYGKADPLARINRAVNQVYEPGSTFKVLTVGAALEENLTTPDELIDCLMGSILIAGHRIHDSTPHGLISVSEVLEQSSDVGAIKLGLRLGPDRFYEYVQRLGFGRPTGVDLPGEERGLLRPPTRWSGMSLASMSMGQEVGVTPLQILSMISAVANGGILYRPYVVKEIRDPHNGIIETDSHGERVLAAETAAKLRPMMEGVLTEGTARSSKLEGYTSAGKTGTAQKVIDGHYSKTKFWGSFAGFAPATNPTLAMIVMVDQAVGLHQGGQVAAPVFKRVMEQALRYMSVPPDVPLYAPQYKVKQEPERPVKPPITEAATVKYVQAGFTASLTDDMPELGDVTVPDFQGKSLRQVTEESLKAGLRLQSAGSGAAVAQAPPAGASVRAGAPVRVRFSSRASQQ